MTQPSHPRPPDYDPEAGGLQALDGIAYGGDYNPEQWPEEVWTEDARLMRDVGVNLVTVGVFSWAALEPRPGEFTFGWLDRVVDLLHEHGVAVDLATPTAGPPAWLYEAHPEAWVMDRFGTRLGPGSRGMMCPSSSAYAEAAASITTAIAERYAEHPGVVMWHVHNEYGAPVSACHCPASNLAFRSWLADRYGDVEGVNAAWGTSFWGQRYGRWEEIRTPAVSASFLNPAQQLDYARFCDDELRRCYVRERDILRAQPRRLPVTTNFMATSCPSVDLWKWAREVDLVSNDHYLTGERTDAHVMLAMDADLTRSLAGGRPWLLMEHSPSAVNWQPRNIAKQPGEMARNSFAHVARGADGALFFQWRASLSGVEKFHSAMLPHGGTSTRVWQEVGDLGDALGRLGEVRGSRVHADVALVWDWESFWAQSLEWQPSVDLDPRERVEAIYSRLWADGVTVDFVHPGGDLSGYRLVIVPQLYVVSAQSGKNLEDYIESGGHLVVSYYSGVVDENVAVHRDGLVGPLAQTLGIRVEEFHPLRAGEAVEVDWVDSPGSFASDVWTERVLPEPGTEVIARFRDGPVPGGPAITRRHRGRGSCWYVATRLDHDSLGRLFEAVYREAAIGREQAPPGVEVIRRHGAASTWTFAINHTSDDVELDGAGTEVLVDEPVAGTLVVPAGQVRVIRHEHQH